MIYNIIIEIRVEKREKVQVGLSELSMTVHEDVVNVGID